MSTTSWWVRRDTNDADPCDEPLVATHRNLAFDKYLALLRYMAAKSIEPHSRRLHGCH